jgi:hypothetical protein
MTKLIVAFCNYANAPKTERDDSNYNVCEVQTEGRRFETQLEHRPH